MSLEWKRLHADATCGGQCRAKKIAAGRPVLDVTTPGGHKFRRCESCAAKQGWTPPADIPLADRVELKSTMLTRFTSDSLPLDFKSAAAGRQPGEDDE